jgi:hypothetical protein
MICPDSNLDCDNPGCRRGGCQGRRPSLPLFRAHDLVAAKRLPLIDAAIDHGAAAIAKSDRPERVGRGERLAAA